LQAVAARGDPVVSQRCPHENRNDWIQNTTSAPYPPSGTDRCSCTNTHDLPRFSQIPV
jgi:hypothetical protein